MIYRRRIKSDTWHFCRNCSLWPPGKLGWSFVQYRGRAEKPYSGKLCPECLAKRKKGGVQVTDLVELKDRIAHHAEQVAKMFKDPRVTIVVRAPSLPDGDVVVTDDDLDSAIKAIERLKRRPAIR